MLSRQRPVESDYQVKYLIQTFFRSIHFIGDIRVDQQIHMNIAIAGVTEIDICDGGIYCSVVLVSRPEIPVRLKRVQQRPHF